MAEVFGRDGVGRVGRDRPFEIAGSALLVAAEQLQLGERRQRFGVFVVDRDENAAQRRAVGVTPRLAQLQGRVGEHRVVRRELRCAQVGCGGAHRSQRRGEPAGVDLLDQRVGLRERARSHVDELELDRRVDRDLVGDRAPPRIELVVPERGAFDAEVFPVDRRRPGEAEALVSPRILQQRMRGDQSDHHRFDHAVHRQLAGELTMHGVVKPVVIALVPTHPLLKDAWGNQRLGFTGTTTIDRKDFGIEGTAFWNNEFDPGRRAIADEIAIDAAIELELVNMGSRAFPKADALIKQIDAGGLAAALTTVRAAAPDLRAPEFSAYHAMLANAALKLRQAGRYADGAALCGVLVAIDNKDAEALAALAELELLGGDDVDLHADDIARGVELGDDVRRAVSGAERDRTEPARAAAHDPHLAGDLRRGTVADVRRVRCEIDGKQRGHEDTPSPLEAPQHPGHEPGVSADEKRTPRRGHRSTVIAKFKDDYTPAWLLSVATARAFQPPGSTITRKKWSASTRRSACCTCAGVVCSRAIQNQRSLAFV